MTGNTFGKIFKITTWGESHGVGLGCIIDGVPADIRLDEKYIQTFLDKRKPGQSKFTTNEKKTTKWKSSQVCLMEKQRVHQFHF